MKYFLSLFLLFFLSINGNPTITGANPISSDCTFKGIKLYGEFRVVDSFPDIRVQVVNNSPDLRVKKINITPNRCGEWKIVNYFSAKSIQFVDSFPDIRIEYSEFPGISNSIKFK
jgi:hypothetical protein